MKKLIIASVCTIALSLFGTIGANQNLLTVKAATNTIKIDSKVSNKDKKPVLIYKNIDLSKCKTTDEVIKVLQENGYKNINKDNIKKIKSLKKIVSYINKTNKTTGNAEVKQPTVKQSIPTSIPTATPAPTAVPTAKPTPTTAPTVKPTPTAAPTVQPTQAPAPTVKPNPTVAPSKPVNSSDNTGINSYADQVLQLVNQERAKAGLSSFTTAPALTAAANKRAEETKVSFSHTRPNGTSFTTALQEYNVVYRTAGENIAYGQKTPQEVVTGWMNSPGHRANILNGNFNKLGIGVYSSNGVIYWAQLFTN